jgi:hypothetical protein
MNVVSTSFKAYLSSKMMEGTIFSIISHYIRSIYFYFHMPPKTTFTVPMGDVVEVVTQTRRSKRGIRTTEKEVPFHSSKSKKPSKASGSGHPTQAPVEVVETQASIPPHDIEGSHTYQLMEEPEDPLPDVQIEDTLSQSNVCTIIHSYIVKTLMICRHQWTNGSNSAADISTFYWRWRDSQSPQSAPCAPAQWR